MKTKRYIVNTEAGNINFEWVNGRKYPESIWMSREAKVMTERQKDYICEYLTNNCSGWGIDGWLVINVI